MDKTPELQNNKIRMRKAIFRFKFILFRFFIIFISVGHFNLFCIEIFG